MTISIILSLQVITFGIVEQKTVYITKEYVISSLCVHSQAQHRRSNEAFPPRHMGFLSVQCNVAGKCSQIVCFSSDNNAKNFGETTEGLGTYFPVTSL